MKRLAVLGMCLCLSAFCPLTAHAEESAVISATVPDTHSLTVTANEDIKIEVGTTWIQNGDTVKVNRLSSPSIMLELTSEQNFSKAFLNGIDITDQIRVEKYGYIASYYFEPVYEDMTLEIEIESNLPQTGYSNIYRIIEISALLMTTTGIVIVSKTKKEKE